MTCDKNLEKCVQDSITAQYKALSIEYNNKIGRQMWYIYDTIIITVFFFPSARLKVLQC